MLINQGIKIANSASDPESDRTKQQLRPIVAELFGLLPKADQPITRASGVLRG